MKISILFLLTVLLVSCKKENSKSENSTPQIASIEKGQTLFEENNCVACHQLNQKVVGPSLQEMAKIYKEKKGNLVLFLKGEAQPIVDPSQYETMKLNLEITKTMTIEELKSLELYILNQSK